MVGGKFGRWTVIAPLDAATFGRGKWLFRCECGVERPVNIYGARAGQTLSCGCLNREMSSKRHRQHGLTDTKIYRVWKNMRKRCEKPNSTDYYLYGARGIKVCERWHDFAAFYEDMGDLPFAGAQIDRIDVDGDYAPSNCRWVTATENMRNRHTNHYITYKGETRCVTEWEQIKGFPRDRIRTRLKKGWGLEDAMETPVLPRGARKSAGTARSVVL